MSKVNKAIEALKKGEIVLIYDSDGREEETDLVVGSQFITPEIIRTMRKDGGGLICTAVHYNITVAMGIPYITEILKKASKKFPSLKYLKADDIPYDERSSFSITINHRKTFTGITDNDRALTIKEFTKLAASNNKSPEKLGRDFRSPGHVILLKAAEGLLKNRQGHTELSIALAETAGLTPVTTICEMMGDDGSSMPLEETRRYAKVHGLSIVEGKELIKALKNNYYSHTR